MQVDPKMAMPLPTYANRDGFRLVPPSDEEDPQRAKAVDEILRRIKERKGEKQ